MEIITNLISNIQIIAVSIIIILLLFTGVGVYLFKIKKKTVTEGTKDYAGYDRKNVLDYVKFDDVAEDMVVAGGNKRFIGAIKCQGFDYPDAEIEEKLQTIRGYVTFFNVLDNSPIQFRQSARDVNLDRLIQSYQEQLGHLQERRFLLDMEYTEMKEQSEAPDISVEDYDVYYARLRKMQRELLSLGYQAEQLTAQIQYMIAISGENADSKREQIYVFDWNYNPIDFSSQMLDTQEIYQRASAQLKSKGDAYINALRNCGVHAKRASGVEILEEIGRYTHPVSSAKGSADDIMQSAYDSICVTSDSLRELEKKANKEILKEIGQEMLVEKMGRKGHA